MYKNICFLIFVFSFISILFSEVAGKQQKDLLEEVFSKHLDFEAYDVFDKLQSNVNISLENEYSHLWNKMHALYFKSDMGGFLHYFSFFYLSLSSEILIKKYYDAILFQQQSNPDTFLLEELPWWLWNINFSFMWFIWILLFFIFLLFFWGVLQLYIMNLFSWFPEKGFSSWLNQKKKILFRSFYTLLCVCVTMLLTLVILEYLYDKEDYRVLIGSDPVSLLIDLEVLEEKTRFLEPGTIILKTEQVGLWTKVLLTSGQEGFIQRSLLSDRLGELSVKKKLEYFDL